MKKIFNLKENYTKDELTSKFNEKIKEINNLNISLLDKHLLLEQYDKEYKKLLNKFVINNIFNTFRSFEMPQIIAPQMNQLHMPLIDQLNSSQVLPILGENQLNLPQINSNYSASSYSYSSQVNPDGVRTVYHHNKTNNNGIVNEVTNQYIIDKNGNRVYCNNNFN